jgi:hypothetical protein
MGSPTLESTQKIRILFFETSREDRTLLCFGNDRPIVDRLWQSVTISRLSLAPATCNMVLIFAFYG